MQTWVIQAISMGVALSVQVAAIAFFLGKMKAYQESNAALVNQIQSFADERLRNLATRVDSVDAFTREAAKSFTGFDARLSELSTNTRDLPAFRERFAAFEAKTMAHQERQESEGQRVHASIESLQRQVAALAVHGGGHLVELPPVKKGI